MKEQMITTDVPGSLLEQQSWNNSGGKSKSGIPVAPVLTYIIMAVFLIYFYNKKLQKCMICVT